MIQSSDQDILKNYDRLPHHLSLEITRLFKEFFNDVFLFDEVQSIARPQTPLNIDFEYLLRFRPEFLLKGNRHLTGYKKRGLDSISYTQYNTQTVAQMRSVLDLLTYRVDEFVKWFNDKKFEDVSIKSEIRGLSHNTNLSHDCSKLNSQITLYFTYSQEILQMEDLAMTEDLQLSVSLNERYNESEVRINQWSNTNLTNMITPIKF